MAAERRGALDDDGLPLNEEYLDAKTSKIIMQQAQLQREEEESAQAGSGGKTPTERAFPTVRGASFVRCEIQTQIRYF